MKVRLVLTGRLTVLGFDLAWFSSLSSEHLCIFGLHGEGTGFDNVGHHLGLATRTQISVCKSPFLSEVLALSGETYVVSVNKLAGRWSTS